MNLFAKRLLATVAVPLFALAASPALAEQDNSAALEEVVVTAERFKSTVQTTPVAVSAFSETVLQERQVASLRDANGLVPGVLIVPTTGNVLSARVVVRGAGQESGGILFDPAVGIYVDNVYQPRINGAFFDVFDIEGLEVLRGPQGTLYGRNTSGGAIKIQTKRPADYLTYGGDIAVGNHGQLTTRGYVSGPLVDGLLAGSLSGVLRKRDGLVKSPFYDEAKSAIDSRMIRGKLLFTPTDKFEIEAAIDTMADDSDPGLAVPLQVANGVVNPNAVPGRDPFTSELGGPFAGGMTSTGGSITATYRPTDELTIASISGYRNLRLYSMAPFWMTLAAQQNNDPSRNIGNNYFIRDEFFSQEITATYTTERLKLVGGVYFFDEEGVANYKQPYATPADHTRGTTASAVFGQVTYEIGSGLSVTGGLRATREKAKLTQFYYTQRDFEQSDSKTFSGVTPKFGVSWQASPDLLVYGSYTKGFKSGGFNAVPPNANTGVGLDGAPTPYGQEELDSFEVGFKLAALDRRLRLNVAAFQANYDGLQLPVFFPGTTTSYTSNAAGARIRGVEIEPTWQVTSSLRLYGNAAFNTGKYTDPFLCALSNTQIVDCSDNNIKGLVPKKTSLGFNYRPDLPIPGQLNFNAVWNYNDAYYNNVSNELPLVQTPKLSLFDASVAWESPDDHWRISLEARNLFNKHYILQGLQLSNAVRSSVSGYPGDPRMVVVRIGANF